MSFYPAIVSAAALNQECDDYAVFTVPLNFDVKYGSLENSYLVAHYHLVGKLRGVRLALKASSIDVDANTNWSTVHGCLFVC